MTTTDPYSLEVNNVGSWLIPTRISLENTRKHETKGELTQNGVFDIGLLELDAIYLCRGARQFCCDCGCLCCSHGNLQ